MEEQVAKNRFGPSAMYPSSPLYKMKMGDQHFESMLNVSRNIRKQEMNNPNAYGWYLVNATQKFEEQDQIEKMKKAQQNIQEIKKSHKLTQLVEEDKKSLGSLPKNPLDVEPKREIFDLQDRKLDKQEKDMQSYKS